MSLCLNVYVYIVSHIDCDCIARLKCITVLSLILLQGDKLKYLHYVWNNKIYYKNDWG